MENRAVGKVLRNTLSRTHGSALYPCPDDNALAAYLDGSLSPGERLTLEEHTSRCESCRSVLGLALDLATGESVAKPAPKPVRTSVFWWLRSPVAITAAAALTVVVGAVLLTVVNGPMFRKPAPQFSSVRTPEEKPRALNGALDNAPRVPAQQPAVGVPPPPHAPAPSSRPTRMAAQNAPAAAEGNRVASDARGAIADASATAAGVAVEGRSDGRAVAEMKAEAAAIPQLQGEDQARPAEPAPASKAVAVNAGREELRLAQRAALAERELSPAQAVQMLWNRGSGAFETRHLEGLFFSLVGDYWIDGRCAGQRDSGIIETVQGSSEAREIMASIPRVADLLQGGRRVIIQHAGKLYLLPKPQTLNRNQQNQDR